MLSQLLFRLKRFLALTNIYSRRGERLIERIPVNLEDSYTMKRLGHEVLIGSGSIGTAFVRRMVVMLFRLS